MNKESKDKVKINICQIKDCGRLIHKKSKYCIFHAKPKEKSEEEFKIALKKYIEEIKEEDKNYDFEGFIFIGNIDFKEDLNITIFKNARFDSATFEREACFVGATFKGDTWFDDATFKEYTSFSGTTFKEHAGFYGATFKGIIGFDSATFERDAFFEGATFNELTSFFEATFKDSAYFEGVTFKGDTSFFEAAFKRDVNFEKAIFKRDALFEGATFNEDMNFQVKSFVMGVSFKKVSISPGKKLNFKVENNKGNVSFERAYLENTYLDLDLGADVLIDFTDTLLKNTKIEKNQIENRILQEEQKEFSEAKEVYLLLKNNFHSIGKYENESWAFKKEKDMVRKGNYHFKTLHKWLWSYFLNALYGYGEKPERVIVSAIAIIIIFAFVFMNFGVDANPQLDTLPKYNILKELFMGIRYGDLLVRLKDISLEQIKNCLYFSTVTFTTLGLGDFRPVEGWGRIFVGAEAFIGALMMALFVYTFARRTGGR